MMRPIHVAKIYISAPTALLPSKWLRSDNSLFFYFSVKTIEMTSEKVINIFWPEFDHNVFYTFTEWSFISLGKSIYMRKKVKLKRERNGKFSVHLAIPQWLNLDRRRLSLFGKLNTSNNEMSEVQHKISITRSW